MHLLFHHWNKTAAEDVDITLTDGSASMSTPTKEVKKGIVRNIFRDSGIVKLYFIHVILLYGFVVLILRWWCDYIFLIAYIWIYKSYDSDDMSLTQMVLKSNSEVNDEDEILEDGVEDLSFREDEEYSCETDD